MEAAVWLLPQAQREWGSAMRAELYAVESYAGRWRFVAGCLRAMATEPTVLRTFGNPFLALVVLGASLWWTGRFEYAPLRLVSLAVVAILVALGWTGRTHAPVHHSLTARAAWFGGCLLVVLWTAGLMASIAAEDPYVAAQAGVPIIGAISACYLVGFLALTTRPAVTARVLTAGLTGGSAALFAWTAAVVAMPPIPVSTTSAGVLIIAGMGVAAIVGDGDLRLRLQAVAYAGMVAAILIASMVMTLSAYAPADLIPDLAPHALSPAADLAQSRNEVQDPYLVLLVIGAGFAVVGTFAALRGNRSHSPPATVIVA